MDNNVRKSAELATHYYINPSTMEPNVDGLILAAPGDYKATLTQSDKFDPKLADMIVNVVDVTIGGEGGFHIAIHQTSKVLEKDRRIIVKLFDEITKETGKYVYGLDDTLKALASKPCAVETLILWENLDINRYVMKNRETGETVIKHLNKEEEGNTENFNIELDVEEKMSLLDWLGNECARFGCALEFVNNKSLEGKQFCKGLEGIGAILRYPLDLSAVDPEDRKPNQEDGPHSNLSQPRHAHSNKVIGESSLS
ncbi:PREDICTED: eukaryotic peptide chain release factor subunit 1-1-like [Camelina sativa]|uniref:Eukaryotic peptide chain release factor subunit 1-1-like n=1 Tax=Camelina sativa TaxID=90675 RepID=A0ABM0UTF8_CAMSA|nr:PREDICTED: eukaryotic peptide chain release factor subunit 1-1-like [Camelina sativa]